MVSILSSQEFLNGRMLLHLLLASIPCFEKELENYLTLLKATISIYPEAAFKTVYEEIRLLRVDNPQEGVDRGNTQTFTMHVRKMHWSPVQKAKEVKNTKVNPIIFVTSTKLSSYC